MIRICIRCGKTDKEVRFDRQVRPNGTVYIRPVCGQCIWKYNKKRAGLVRQGLIPQGIPGRAKRPMRGSVYVLWCPNEEYPRGNFFNNAEFRETLNEGYWPLGMLIKIKEQKYAVCGSGVVMKTWRQLNYPLNVEWPEQWLIEINGRARV